MYIFCINIQLILIGILISNWFHQELIAPLHLINKDFIPTNLLGVWKLTDTPSLTSILRESHAIFLPVTRRSSRFDLRTRTNNVSIRFVLSLSFCTRIDPARKRLSVSTRKKREREKKKTMPFHPVVSDGTSSSRARHVVNQFSWMSAYVRSAEHWSSARLASRIPASICASWTTRSVARAWRPSSP